MRGPQKHGKEGPCTDRGGAMARDNLSGFSSAFDEMLERNRRELEALGGGRRSDHRPRRRTGDGAESYGAGRSYLSSLAEAGRDVGSNQGLTESAAERRPDSETRLDVILGPGWSYQILDRFRDGEEMIVRCRVTDANRTRSRTQYGSSTITSVSSRSSPAKAGTAGGVSFGFGSQDRSAGNATPSVSTERAAETKAVESALAACARLF